MTAKLWTTASAPRAPEASPAPHPLETEEIHGYVFLWCFRVLGNEIENYQKAEDLKQDVILGAWNEWHQFQSRGPGPGSLKAWLRACVRTAAFNYLHRERNMREYQRQYVRLNPNRNPRTPLQELIRRERFQQARDLEQDPDMLTMAERPLNARCDWCEAWYHRPRRNGQRYCCKSCQQDAINDRRPRPVVLHRAGR